MEFIKLNNGIDMPIVGFGTWDVRGSEGLTALKTAIDIGYRLFDTAEMYANQDIVGKAIRESGIDRSEFFITTKLCRPHIDYNSAKKAIEQDLKTLNTDYIDLLLIHEPYSSANAMYKAFEEAYEQGKVRAIGVSNFSQSFYDNFITNCNIIPTINQVESHVYYPQLELKAHMEKHAALLRPRFELVLRTLEENLKGTGAGTWTEPKGGYFITFEAVEGCASRIVELAKEAGVVLTPAGSPFPYGKDPKDAVIRIAPSYPTLEELDQAGQVFVVCAKLATVEKLLAE